MCNTIGHAFGKPQHNGARNGSLVAAFTEIAQAFLGEAHLRDRLPAPRLGPGRPLRN
jgi:hypothetical protein